MTHKGKCAYIGMTTSGFFKALLRGFDSNLTFGTLELRFFGLGSILKTIRH
jgi:hypothetical protein